jgi:hypothetical protein
MSLVLITYNKLTASSERKVYVFKKLTSKTIQDYPFILVSLLCLFLLYQKFYFHINFFKYVTEKIVLFLFFVKLLFAYYCTVMLVPLET